MVQSMLSNSPSSPTILVERIAAHREPFKMQVISRLVNMESTILRMVPSALACSRLAGGVGHSSHSLNKVGRGFCTVVPNNAAATPTAAAQDNQGTASPQQPSVTPPEAQPQQRSFFDDMDSYPMSPTVRRRPYNLEAKMRMKQYRREAMLQRRQQELEEEQRTFQLDYTTIYKKGDPGTVQGVIKEIINLGYIVTLPNGREGLLAASHLGCSGGIPLLERLFKVGQEIAIRVIPVPNPAGKDRVYVRP
ncbi:hypothetical protein GOP47_0016667 [Adiantum capillus-veneris]|uniref:S1 motif domain-containing protein n=1 Tax=Adiantum capillus-veneris TaxID=13818 RepID=A0A9D4UIS0_ADICA|nr:hypothetical protein GOP47_0016667 [Adiantum capillus-veneris]